MPTLDPAFLLLTSGLVALVLTVMLLVSRIGLGDAALGVRTWIVGHVVMAVSRGAVLVELLQSLQRAAGQRRCRECGLTGALHK